MENSLQNKIQKMFLTVSKKEWKDNSQLRKQREKIARLLQKLERISLEQVPFQP